MNYELAKKLKDVGFPQEQKYWVVNGRRDYIGNHEEAYYPTLSELIEACEATEKIDCFTLQHNCIINFRGKETPQTWRVTTMKNEWSNDKYEIFGDTPEEAVALLYISLQTPPTTPQ